MQNSKSYLNGMAASGDVSLILYKTFDEIICILSLPQFANPNVCLYVPAWSPTRQQDV